MASQSVDFDLITSICDNKDPGNLLNSKEQGVVLI